MGYAQDDVLPDATFGANGEVTSLVGDTSLEFSAIAFQSDGKLVTYGPTNPNSGWVNNYKLARYNTDGSLDTTFGNAGFQNVISCFRAYYLSIPSKSQLKIQPDGKILIARMIDTNPHPNINYFDIVVNRYNTNGTLDTTFGTNGEVVRNYSDTDMASFIEIQPDNKILIAGYSDLNIMVFRLNSNGSLDQSFGTNGTVLESFKPFDWSNYIFSHNYINSLKLQSDGKIVLGGDSVPNSGSNPDVGLMRLNSDGTLDTTFGVGGRFFYESGKDDYFNSMVLTAENKIVVFFNTSVFYSSTVIPTAKIFRLTATGQIDTSFGVDGFSTPILNANLSSNLDAFIDVAVDANQKYVFIGYSGSAIGSPLTKYIGRYNSDITIDKAFNHNGYKLISPQNLSTVSIQDDEKIIYGGNNMTRLLFGTLSNDEFHKNEFSIAPNPFLNIITLNFNLNTPEVLSADLYDSNGRNIKNILHESSFSFGINSIQLNMPENLSKGVYFLNITKGTTVSTIKIVK